MEIYKNRNISNCEWVIQQAEELKALLSYDGNSILMLNHVRALSAIETAMTALTELKTSIEAVANVQPKAKSCQRQAIPQSEDTIVSLVKAAIHGNSTFEEDTGTVTLDSNDIDHLAEELAKLVASGSPAPIPSKPQFRQCFELTENCKKPQTMFRRFEKKYPRAWEVWGELFEYMLANELDSMGEKGWQLWLQTDEEARTHYMSIVLTDPQQRIL